MSIGPLPLGRDAWERTYGKEPAVRIVNRYLEANPTNRVDGVALLSRPPSTALTGIGSGPIRANFAQEGTFDGALFSVSGDKLFRIDKDLAKLHIAGTIHGTGTPSMAGTDTYLFIADGESLQFYDGVGSHAQGTLTCTLNPANTNTVTIQGVVYTFKTVLASAYDVLIGASIEESLQNLADAINAQAETVNIGYKGPVVANPAVYAGTSSTTALIVYARVGGTAGNAITTTETLANGSWGGATLAGGVNDALSGVPTPDDVGIVSMCVLASYVLCAAAGSDRIYFIRPGAFLIDPLDFFTAESIPDQVISLMTVGDNFAAFGAQSTDWFYATGDADAPFAPIQGRGFSRGVLEGTAALVDANSVIVVADDGIVYSVSGGPQRISTNGIEELIRRARRIERDAS